MLTDIGCEAKEDPLVAICRPSRLPRTDDETTEESGEAAQEMESVGRTRPVLTSTFE